MEPLDSEPARSNRVLLAFNLVLALVLSAIAGSTIALHLNVLNAHAEWISTKTELEKGVMGALAFVNLPQALAGNRLNLGAWFGYQEVLYRDAMELSSLDLKFQLDPGGYLDVLYDHRASGFTGARFSNREDRPSIHYKAAPSGEFVDVEEMDVGMPVSAGGWHGLRINFGNDSAIVVLDDKVIGDFERTPGTQRIGMRGSQRNTWVDDITMVRSDATTIREDFVNRSLAWRAAAATLAILLIATAITMTIAPRTQISSSARGLWLAMIYMVLIVVCLAAYVAQRISVRSYPLLTESRQEFEAYWINSSYESILEDIRNRYGAAPAEDEFRILFVGGSQTWGAGARTESDTWVRQTELLLNTNGDSVRFVCINGGFSGFTSENVLNFLRDNIRGYHARAAVLNLGNNDMDPAALEDNFDAILDLLTQADVQPILVPEANSSEKLPTDSRHGDLSEKHRILTDLAEAHGVPVIDMHEHLASRRNAGLVWWDFSHLTSYGQRLVAEHLRSRLPEALGVR